MPTYGTRCGAYPANETAGTQVSSDQEGRHLQFLESELHHPTHSPDLVDKGDPCVVGREIVGVAFSSAIAATDPISLDSEGIWNLSVVATNDLGAVAVVAGDALFINRSTCVISKIADPAVNTFFGTAYGAITSGATATIAVKVHFDPNGEVIDDSIIVVSTSGNDTYGKGSWSSPVASVTKALTLLTATRLTIYIMPGDYAEAATLTWPNLQGARIIGMDGQGNVVISNANAAAQVLLINPTYTAETLECFLENVCIKHAAQVGIQVNNTNMTRKLLIHLKGVSTEQVTTGDSIDVLHATAGQAIRIYAVGCDEIEGLVDIDGANADDRFRFDHCVLIGGITEVGAVAGEIAFLNTIILTSGLTIDAAMVITYHGSCWRTDAGVYSALADGYSG